MFFNDVDAFCVFLLNGCVYYPDHSDCYVYDLFGGMSGYESDEVFCYNYYDFEEEGYVSQCEDITCIDIENAYVCEEGCGEVHNCVYNSVYDRCEGI